MINEQEFFNRLLQLPLFQGIGRGEFVEIARSIRIGFERVHREHVVVRQDEACTQLFFVLHGETRIARQSDNHGYTLTEWQTQPLVVQPEVLFGLTTRYTRTYTVARGTEIIAVDKAAVRDLLFDYPTFRINYLNLVSTQMQQASRLLWLSRPANLTARLVQFVGARLLRPAGKKELQILRPQLAQELQDTPLNVSRVLLNLQREQLVTLHRGRIVVPSFEKLLQYSKQ